MSEWISLDECENGVIYELRSRNLWVGVFKEKTKGFIGIRRKFDSEYLFTEYHHDTGPPFGTARPVRVLGRVPKDMPLWERYPQVTCQRCGERVVTEGEIPNFTRRHVYTELGPPIECDDNPSPFAGRDYSPLFLELMRYQEDLMEEES